MLIPSPCEIKNSFSLSEKGASFIAEIRQEVKQALLGNSSKRVLLVGPCSIHDKDAALEYADRLQALAPKVQNFLLVMRLFLEKPRTKEGWKGLLYDPRLDGSNDVIEGLLLGRKLLIDLANKKVPAATELLEPLLAPYFADLLTWGMIGARTSASQPHRQLASSLSFPVGFKNDIHGELDVAIYGILASQRPHSHISINEEGRICAKQTTGNPLTHLVLRGSNTKTNYDSASIALALSELQKNNLLPRIIIDCSHGNSKKNHLLQSRAFKSVIEQCCNGNQAIRGLMLESNLKEGKQLLSSNLIYGVSITDACIGWEETESFILSADEQCNTSIDFVHN